MSVPEQKAPVVNVTDRRRRRAGRRGGVISDWPEGTTGFTVQLQRFPTPRPPPRSPPPRPRPARPARRGSGALNSDDYASLPTRPLHRLFGCVQGQERQDEAQRALKRLKKNFPGAKVVEVRASDAALEAKGESPRRRRGRLGRASLKDLENSTGEEQQEKSAQLPDRSSSRASRRRGQEEAGGGGGDAEVIE